MEKNNYSKAYTEVLEIISYFSEDEYSKIPSDKIKFFEENKDSSYDYKINPEVDLDKQSISKEASSILVYLYREYFASEHQRNVLDDILMDNQRLLEKEKEIKYNSNKIFESTKEQVSEGIESEEKFASNETENKDNSIVTYKESFFVKLKKFILRILHIEK